MSEAAKPWQWPGTRNNVWQRRRGGALLAARPGQVLGLLQTRGHRLPHFPFFGSL